MKSNTSSTLGSSENTYSQEAKKNIPLSKKIKKAFEDLYDIIHFAVRDAVLSVFGEEDLHFVNYKEETLWSLITFRKLFNPFKWLYVFLAAEDIIITVFIIGIPFALAASAVVLTFLAVAIVAFIVSLFFRIISHEYNKKNYSFTEILVDNWDVFYNFAKGSFLQSLGKVGKLVLDGSKALLGIVWKLLMFIFSPINDFIMPLRESFSALTVIMLTFGLLGGYALILFFPTSILSAMTYYLAMLNVISAKVFAFNAGMGFITQNTLGIIATVMIDIIHAIETIWVSNALAMWCGALFGLYIVPTLTKIGKELYNILVIFTDKPPVAPTVAEGHYKDALVIYDTAIKEGNIASFKNSTNLAIVNSYSRILHSSLSNGKVMDISKIKNAHWRDRLRHELYKFFGFDSPLLPKDPEKPTESAAPTIGHD